MSSASLESVWRGLAPDRRLAIVQELVEYIHSCLLSYFAAVSPQFLHIVRYCIAHPPKCLLPADVVYAWQIRQTPPALRVPLEVWWMIFDWAVYQEHSASLPFWRMRARVMLVCASLRSYALSYKPFWTTLRVSPDSTRMSVKFFLDTVGERPLRVAVVDGGYSWPDERIRSAKLRQAFARCVLSARQWTSLFVLSPLPGTINHVFDTLAHRPLIQLEELYVDSQLSLRQRALGLSPNILRHPERVVRLDLRGAGCSAIRLPDFGALQVLRLIDLPYSAWPTSSHFFDFLQSAESLHELQLYHTGFRGPFLPSPTPKIALPSLRVFKVYFDHRIHKATECLYPLLARLHLSSLAVLSLQFGGDQDLFRYRANEVDLTASVVHVVGALREPELMEYLYSTFASCEHLDVSTLDGYASFQVLGRLGVDSPPSAIPLLPRLSILSVPNRHWEKIYDGLLQRSSRGRILQQLRVVVPKLEANPIHSLPAASLYDYTSTTEIVPEVVWVERRPLDVYSDVARV
ncbi:hypothetical protein R3P38DRAFT_3214428 [Favolaschia claudopus]|uniref:F-box domain-containing protein n=1 Tax=Favolaschia claudopus TaxID=2862362 RepID=A0AAW0AC19_9AGAR